MSIKIVFPEGDKIKVGCGTKVINEDTGEEIKDIYSLDLRIAPNEIITATLTIAVSGIENAEGIEGLVVFQDIEDEH